jgi:hypothetical protein
VTLADAPSKADAAAGCRSERFAPVTKAAAPQATGIPMTTRIAAAATVLGTRRGFDRRMVFSLCWSGSAGAAGYLNRRTPAVVGRHHDCDANLT